MKFTSAVIFVFTVFVPLEIFATVAIETEFTPVHPEQNAVDCVQRGGCNPCKIPFQWHKEKNTCYLPDVNKCDKAFKIRTSYRQLSERPSMRNNDDEGKVITMCKKNTCKVILDLEDVCIGDSNYTTIVSNLTISVKNMLEAVMMRDDEKFGIKPLKALSDTESNQLRLPVFHTEKKVTLDFKLMKHYSINVAAEVCCRALPQDNWCPEGFVNLPSTDTCDKVFTVVGKPSWEERLEFCNGIGRNGRLAFIDTEQISEELAVALSSVDDKRIYENNVYAPLLIGLKQERDDCGSSFVWTDGKSTKPMTFESFNEYEPNCNGRREHCVIMWLDYNRKKTIWNDVLCDAFTPSHRILCEISP